MSKELAPWQQRVLKERDELSEKISALQSFIDDEEKMEPLLPYDRTLLRLQYSAMVEYRRVLVERIARFIGPA